MQMLNNIVCAQNKLYGSYFQKSHRRVLGSDVKYNTTTP